MEMGIKIVRICSAMTLLATLCACGSLGGSVSGEASFLGQAADATDASSEASLSPIETVDIYAPIAKLETPNALRLYMVISDSDGSSALVGDAETVSAGAEIVVYDDAGTIITTATADETGAFSAPVDASYAGQNLHVAVVDHAEMGIGEPVVVAFHGEGDYDTALSQKTGLLDAQVSIYGDDAIFTVDNGDHTYAITAQPLQGGRQTTYAQSDRPVGQLQYPILGRQDSAFDLGAFFVGVDDQFSVIKIGDGFIDLLSDFISNGVYPEFGGEALHYSDMHIALQPSGGFVLAQGRQDNGRPMPLTVMPTTPGINDDIWLVSGNTRLDRKIAGREITWMGDSQFVSLTSYDGGMPGIPDGGLFRAELYDVRDIVAAPGTAINGLTRAVYGNPYILFETDFPVRKPTAIPLQILEEDREEQKVIAMECSPDGVSQICLHSMTTGFEQLTDGDENKTDPTISKNGVFIAFERHTGPQNVQVNLYHIPSGQVIPLTRGKTAMNLHPTFSPTDTDVLFYMCSLDESAPPGGKVPLYPCVKNLKFDNQVGKFIPESPFYDPRLDQ